MSNPAHEPASRSTVRSYLAAAYHADDEQLDLAMAEDATREDLDDAVPFGSHAYFVGDKIAARHGWAERDDYDIDEEDEEDDDD